MPRAVLSSGIEIEYDTTGDRNDPTVLLISGFNSQLISWDEQLVRQLAARGLHALRFDNRDVGLSSSCDAPYTLSDMAADAVGLLDHLGVERAHVAGKSMGGMIAQLVAIEHPGRVASLMPIMTRTGEAGVGTATPEASAVLLAPPALDRAGVIEASTNVAVYHSKRHFDPDAVRDLAARQFDRSHYPEGAARQLSAIHATPEWSDGLRRVEAPTLVIHGTDDTLVTPDGGERIAELVPGARFELVADMGHDMPRPLWPHFVDLMSAHCLVGSPT